MQNHEEYPYLSLKQFVTVQNILGHTLSQLCTSATTNSQSEEGCENNLIVV
jgi:hypothetical protein